MLHLTHSPAAPLAHFIEYLWVVRAHFPVLEKQKYFPDGAVELLINLGFPQILHDAADHTKMQFFATSWISGQRSKSIVIGSTETVDLVGIRFRPWGAYPFLRMPLIEFRDQVVDMELVWGGLVAEIRDRDLQSDREDTGYPIACRIAKQSTMIMRW